MQLLKKETLLTAAVLASIHSASSRADSNDSAELDSMEVMGHRTLQQQFDIMAPITVFERDDIERSQAASLAELLHRVAGVTSVTQGTQAHNASLFIRGSNSNHVLILVDGVRVGSASLGVKSVADIPLHMIERVELIRGPRASLWGSDAIGGVIQITTKREQHGEGSLRLSVGSNGLHSTAGSAGLAVARANISVAALNEGYSGYDVIRPVDGSFLPDQPDEDGYRRQSFSMNAVGQWSEQFWSQLSSQVDQGEVEYDASFVGDVQDYRNWFVNLDNHYTLNDIYLRSTLAISRDFADDNYDELVPGADSNVYETRRNQASLLGQYQIAKAHEVIVGVDWYDESLDSVLDFTESQRDVLAAYLVTRSEYNHVTLELSARHDDVEGIDEESTYSAGLGYIFNTQNKIFLTHGTAFKAPSFNDLYFPFGGNPNLVAETASNTELLYRFDHDDFRAELSLYDTDYENLIVWGPLPDNPDIFSPRNVDRARVKGAEATFEWHYLSFNHRLSINHMDARNKNTDQRLARRPYYSAFYELGYEMDKVSTLFELDFQGDRIETGGQILNSRTVFGLSLIYDWSRNVAIKGKIKNLLDKQYEQSLEYPGAGREFVLSASLSFN